MPETREVGRGAQFKQTGFLVVGDFDCFEKRAFGERAVRSQALERQFASDAMQVGKQEALPGKFHEFEGLLQRCFSPRQIARRQQGLGKGR